MNLSKTTSIEDAIEKNYPIYVVYETTNKEIVEWWPFGEKLAQAGAETRCSMHGPDSHEYASWEQYVFIRDRHERHLRQLEEIERRL